MRGVRKNVQDNECGGQSPGSAQHREGFQVRSVSLRGHHEAKSAHPLADALEGAAVLLQELQQAFLHRQQLAEALAEYSPAAENESVSVLQEEVLLSRVGQEAFDHAHAVKAIRVPALCDLV